MVPIVFADDTQDCTITVYPLVQTDDGNAYVDVSVENVPESVNGSNVVWVSFAPVLSEGLYWDTEDDDSIVISPENYYDDYDIHPEIDTSYSGCGYAIGLQHAQGVNSRTWPAGFSSFNIRFYLQVTEEFSEQSFSITKYWSSATKEREYITTDSHLAISGWDGPEVIYAKTPKSDNGTTSAAYTASLSTTTESVQPGDSFQVTLSLAGDEFDSASFGLSYDPSVVEITSIVPVQYDEDLTLTPTYGTVAGKAAITVMGANASASEEGTDLAIITFEALANGDSGIQITSASAAPLNYLDTAIAADITPITITVETLCYGVEDDYANGYSLIYYSPTSALEEGAVMTYDGESMYFLDDGSDYGIWLYLAKLEDGLSKEDFDSTQGTTVSVSRGGNVNSDDVVDIADAQIACDIMRGNHEDFTDATMLMWLNSDITGENNCITADDVLAIQTVIHNQILGIVEA